MERLKLTRSTRLFVPRVSVSCGRVSAWYPKVSLLTVSEKHVVGGSQRHPGDGGTGLHMTGLNKLEIRRRSRKYEIWVGAEMKR